LRKAELEISKVVVIIIALVVLTILLIFIFSAEGGPKNLIDNIIGFLGQTSDYVAESSENI